MTTKQGTATVETETKMIPVAYDGDCSSVPLSEPTVKAALSSFEFKPGYVGFRFAEAAKAKITLDDGTEETFSRERSTSKSYYFGKRVVTVEEFQTSPEFKTDVAEQFRKFSSYGLENKANMVFESERGLKILDEYDQKSSIIINRQGQQLFPLKMA